MSRLQALLWDAADDGESVTLDDLRSWHSQMDLVSHFGSACVGHSPLPAAARRRLRACSGHVQAGGVYISGR